MILSDAPLDLHHVQAIVRAMHEVALSDGMHEAERVMLRGFYDACQQDARALATFDELVATPFDTAGAAELFDTAERRAALLQSCVLLAYADGKYSDGERAKVLGLARAVGIEERELLGIEGAVADHLMQQISRIDNLEALKEVAAELDRR